MNADRVEHRGIMAYQSVYNNHVVLFKNGKIVKHINTNKRKTADELKGIFDEYLEEVSGG